MRSYNPVRKGHSGQIRKALQLLLAAKRPYIYSGGGVVLGNASEELRTLANLLGYPCTNTLMGLGAISGTDPKFLGMLGMHGTIEANNAMQNCDVLLAGRALRRPRDRQPEALRAERAQDHPHRRGSVQHLQAREGRHPDRRRREGSALRADRPDLRDRPAGRRRTGGWWETIEGWRKDCLRYDRANREVIKPQHVIETLWNMTKDVEAYVTSDVGQHQMWARSSTSSPSRAAGSTPAVSAPWAWAFPTPWASSWPSRTPRCTA